MPSLTDLGAKIGNYVLADREDWTTGQTPSVDKIASYSIFGAEGEDTLRWGVDMVLRDVKEGTFWTVSGLSVDPTANNWIAIIAEEEARQFAPDVTFTEKVSGTSVFFKRIAGVLTVLTRLLKRG